MKIATMVGACAVILFAVANAYAEQNSGPPALAPDSDLPETVACAQERRETLGRCSYRVKRDASGKTTVTVIFASGFKRELFFRDGDFLKANVTMSGAGTNGDWSIVDQRYVIRVDGQHFEVPATLIAGG